MREAGIRYSAQTLSRVSTFARFYDEGVPQVAWTRLVADLETPVSVMLKLAHERPNSFLLESVEGGSSRGRYSIIGCEPDLIWRAHGGKAEVDYRRGYPPTVNDADCWRDVQTLAAGLLGSAAVRELAPVMGGEDFAYYGEHARACRAPEAGRYRPPLHR